ncbi:hypothetical protein Lal_00013381 [Lupinus albus]|nr:hypothetical protein Lal_00013381 [Lupinus albus]
MNFEMVPVTEMCGRGRGRGSGQNDLLAQIAAVLMNMNENLQHLNQNVTPSPSSQPLVPPRSAEYRGLDEFCRRNPSQFKGGFTPDAAIEWVQGLEMIFRAMSCSDAQKVAYATYMLRLRLEYKKQNFGSSIRSKTPARSWKPRLIERFSPERKRISWEGEILDEDSRVGEKWQFWAVDTV